MAEGKTVTGGAQVEKVSAQKPGSEPSDTTVNVIATARGALKSGLVEPGTRFTIEVGQFSANWMCPADKRSAGRIEKEKKA